MGAIANCCDRLWRGFAHRAGEVSKNICVSVQMFLCLYKPMGIVQGCGNILGKLRLPPAQRS
ncbi:hypothetical protein, partial [Anabaena sp. CCY 0017]|uniref:hypothetical protein n=1 Tax=Anabaena sp. CCY 0017 TaxID=3103866 RepID=UPI0039C68F56